MKKINYLINLLTVLIFFNLSIYSQNEWTIVATYEIPGKTSGLAWDGTSLYYGIYGSGGSNVYRFDPSTGSAQLHFTNSEIGDAYGMTYDGENLWIIDRGNTGNAYALQLSMEGDILDQVTLPQQYMSGIASTVSGFWIASYYPDPGWIYKIDNTGNILDQFAPPMNQTWDLALAIDAMWIVDYNGNMIFKTDLTGNIVEEHPSITEKPSGVVFDGTYLWYVAGQLGSTSTLYKVNPGGSGAPQLVISQTEFDLGMVTAGNTSSFTFQVTNTGASPLEISFTQPPETSHLSLPEGTVFIDAGNTFEFEGFYSPTEHGYMETNALMHSNDPLQAHTTLSFQATVLESGPYLNSSFISHDFGNLRTDASRKALLRLQNWGNQTLTISEAFTNHEAFFIGDLPGLPFNMAPLGMLELDIWFFPHTSGAYEAILTLENNGPNQNPWLVDLWGTATDRFFSIGESIWEYTIENPYDSSPKAIMPIQDISGDGKADVIVASEDDYIRALNGNASEIGQILWEREIYSGSLYQQQALITIEDINEDGFEDVIAGTAWGDRSVVALSGKTGEIIWKYQTNAFGSGGWVYQVDAKADYNDDAFPDVLAATGDDGTNTGPKRIFCLNGKTGQMIWNYAFNGAVYAVKSIMDITNDGVADVIAGGTNTSETEGRLVAINGANGYQIWELPVSGSTANAIELLDDINGDGIQDIIAGTFNGHLYLINAANGAILNQNYLGNNIILKLVALDDINGDGYTDIVPAHSGYNILAINGFNGEYIWSESVPDKPWNIQRIADISGDGINDIALGTLYQNNYAMFIDGVSGQQLFSSHFGEAIDAIGVLPDVTGDESWEMIAGGRNGKLVCFAGGPDGITTTDFNIHEKQHIQALPNPFSEYCKITVNWPEKTLLRLKIYNLSGNTVFATILDVQKHIPHFWIWNGQTSKGEQVPQGIYLIEVNDGKHKELIKILRINTTD